MPSLVPRPSAANRAWPLFGQIVLLVSLFFCFIASFWEIAHFSIYTKAFDFNYYRNDAANAFYHGWQTFYAGTDNNIDPPLQGIMLFPFLPFSPQVGFVLWTVLSLAAMALIWRLAGNKSWLQLVILCLVFPVVYNLLLGQVVIFLVLFVILAWWLSTRGYALSAGLVLSLATVKPHLILLLPLALLFANRRREFVGFVLGSLSLLALSIALVGLQGVHQVLATIQYVASHISNNYVINGMVLTLTFPGLLGVILTVGCVIFALYLAYRARHAPIEVVFSIGILASLLLTPYLHPQDLVLWVVVALLLARSIGISPFMIALGLLATWLWVPFSGVLFPSSIPLLALIPLVPMISLFSLWCIYTALRHSIETTSALPPGSKSTTIGSKIGV